MDEFVQAKHLRRIQIRDAIFPAQHDIVVEIFSEYAASLQVDLSFQDVAGELANLPGKYKAPAGCVLLASLDGVVIGCAALRPLDAGTAEIKRLYVRPAGRGLQLGRQLAVAICGRARAHGYHRIRLDTMPTMLAAQQLCRSLRFKAVDAYGYNPVDGTQYMQLDLTAPAP